MYAKQILQKEPDHAIKSSPWPVQTDRCFNWYYQLLGKCGFLPFKTISLLSEQCKHEQSWDNGSCPTSNRHTKKKKKSLHVKSVIQHQCSSLWGTLFFVKIFNSRFSSVNGEAERAVHLLPNKPRVSGTRLDCGTCQDSVCGQNSLLCCSFGKLGFFQLPEKQEQIFFL